MITEAIFPWTPWRDHPIHSVRKTLLIKDPSEPISIVNMPVAIGDHWIRDRKNYFNSLFYGGALLYPKISVSAGWRAPWRHFKRRKLKLKKRIRGYASQIFDRSISKKLLRKIKNRKNH